MGGARIKNRIGPLGLGLRVGAYMVDCSGNTLHSLEPESRRRRVATDIREGAYLIIRW